jgi:hypothetical protein
MTDLNRRLHRPEMTQLYRMAAASGAPYDVSAEEVLAQAREFFRLPLDEQLAEIETLVADETLEHSFTAADLAEMRTTLIRHYRPIN